MIVPCTWIKNIHRAAHDQEGDAPQLPNAYEGGINGGDGDKCELWCGLGNGHLRVGICMCVCVHTFIVMFMCPLYTCMLVSLTLYAHINVCMHSYDI